MPLALLVIGASLLTLALLNRVQVTDMDAQQSVPDANAGDSQTMTTAQILALPNVRAFLLMLRYSEGTAGPDGYRTLFGGGLFSSFSDHPRQVVTAMSNGAQIKSSAAGAYQIIQKTWDSVRVPLSLPDFTPASQDAAAVELLRRRGALDLVIYGDVAGAINAARKEWASLPGAGYGQPERRLADLLAAYVNAGGMYA